jgi:hypothetical protein
LTAIISPVALNTASMAADFDIEQPVPVPQTGVGLSLTAAKVVEPLLASWVTMPPSMPGSRQNCLGRLTCEEGVTFLVSSPSWSWPLCRPTGSFHMGLPVWAFSSMMPALPPSMTTACPRAVLSTGEFCRSQSYRSCAAAPCVPGNSPKQIHVLQIRVIEG